METDKWWCDFLLNHVRYTYCIYIGPAIHPLFLDIFFFLLSPPQKIVRWANEYYCLVRMIGSIRNEKRKMGKGSRKILFQQTALHIIFDIYRKIIMAAHSKHNSLNFKLKKSVSRRNSFALFWSYFFMFFLFKINWQNLRESLE